MNVAGSFGNKVKSQILESGKKKIEGIATVMINLTRAEITFNNSDPK